MGNIQKTIRYFKRNGVGKTYYAVLERLFSKDVPLRVKNQMYDGPIDESIKFSVLVPVYETGEKYLREMIDSVLGQVYSNLELVIADASKTDNPKRVIETYSDSRIRYFRLEENKGISENTNFAIEKAEGEYCCLLDHDDFLTPDALYENALVLTKAKQEKKEVNLIYSDEDKCNSDATRYFDSHIKEKLNLDLLLSNNYICHFAVISTPLLKRLKLRSTFDGAQDYDLFLRIVLNVSPESVVHIPKVLYHWRCHEASTSSNPESKQYAYTAGLNAIKDFVREKYGQDVEFKELPHKGFYEVNWRSDIFNIRNDVGAVGSVIEGKNKITHGIYTNEGIELFRGLNRHFSGYMHRAVLTRDVFACDIRTVVPAPSMKADFEELKKVLDDFTERGYHSKREIEELALDLSLEFGSRVNNKGLIFLFIRGSLDN